ncbi:MAG: shikimate dehydrogenase [Actinomycetota bacterium]|nr:shikimate dehydrogenase [Actinomycetota bacterium]
MLRTPSGTTRVAGVIGDPVSHTLSPTLHNAAFQATGLDWVYVAFPVRRGAAADAVGAMRAFRLVGLSVTMPHKTAVVGALDDLTPTAAALGAVNTIIPRGGALLGDSTDGDGFIDALRAEGHAELSGRRIIILGAGGAARAVALAAASAGAAAVEIVGRQPSAVAACTALAGSSGRGAPIDAVGDADVIINATPVGMAGTDLPFGLDPGRLSAGQLVVDLIYIPPTTALLAAAAEQGATVTNGLGMLVHQAARQFAAWTGQPAPLAAMARAGQQAIFSNL